MVANESAYLDLYVDGGNVFFANTPTNLQNFTAQGFPTAVAGVSRGVYVRGNIFVNGVLGGYDLSTNEIAPYAHKLYIHGKMSSLANPLQPAQ
jgi:6-phosphogluconate dehydrogenase (decarboxylating)